jgi:hypothetical protein
MEFMLAFWYQIPAREHRPALRRMGDVCGPISINQAVVEINDSCFHVDKAFSRNMVLQAPLSRRNVVSLTRPSALIWQSLARVGRLVRLPIWIFTVVT